jgi:glycosyltransferase involved in cell wall biosynthesis
MKKISFENKTAVIVIHESEGGPGADLKEYLRNHGIKKLLFIAHPLLFFKDGYKKSSRYELYINGILTNSYIAHHIFLPEPLLYIKDILFTLYWTITIMGKTDIYVGIGNLNAYGGLLLRLLGVVQKVIYYVIDYVPNRFQNKWMNFIYHYIEHISAMKSDCTWNLSPRMIEGREIKWKRKYPHQYVVPHGVHFSRIKRLSFEKKNKYEIIYMGTLMEKQGIQLILDVLPEILKKIPEIRFTIIGKGPYEKQLKEITKQLNIEKYVTFFGFIKDHYEMENRIAHASLAVALYNKNIDIFSYYADPGKIRNYLGSGVPVLATDVPYVAKDIKKYGCGIIVDYDKNSLKNALLTYFSFPNRIREYEKKALSYIVDYDWDIVFSKALSYGI